MTEQQWIKQYKEMQESYENRIKHLEEQLKIVTEKLQNGSDNNR